MTAEELKTIWKKEEDCAFIHGWDFSHIHGRYEEEDRLPWDYESIIRGVLKDDMRLLDYDTGGGEFLLSLDHPYANTAATEGYPPNVKLCKERLQPLGIDIRACKDAARIPFEDESFDIIINRHGDFCPPEIKRLLKPGGLFITQQVGSENDRELVEMVLPGAEKPFPDENLKTQKAAFVDAGFEILQSDEAFGPICFYDVGAFVWFARIIEWEFPGFSVDRCFDRLLQLQETIERDGKICGTTHRYLIVARKPLKETDNSPSERLKEENSMEHKKKGNNWTAYYDPETDRYFAEIMYTSREGREQYDYEITKDIYSRLGTFGDDTDNERLIKTADMTYSFENTMYGTLGPERTVWDEEALKTMEKAVQNQEKKEKEKKKKRS